MASKSQQQEGSDGVLSALNVAIQALNLAKDISGIMPARAAFGSASTLLAMIRDSMANEQDYVNLGLVCSDICTVLARGLEGRRLDELSKSVLGAIELLTVTVATMQKRIIKEGKRNVMSKMFRANSDKDKIAAWRQDLNRILHIFNTELLINNHLILLDIHRSALVGQEGTDGQSQPIQASVTSGESPPPPPRACFGRNELIEKIVDFAEILEPVALIGTGGIGKTSIALSVLHQDRIKDRFHDNRRFIRCDEFPPSCSHFLTRLSEVVGAGVENPRDLASLRPFLSSREMFVVLDNTESILDPQGTDAREIYSMVDELCRFKTIFVCVTSRITTIPQHCKRLVVPTLSAEAACETFYSIYNDCERSGVIDDLLKRLDYHALSTTLLATTASHNMWDCDELANEWDTRRAQVLRTDYSESLAATIELSLASPTFRKLGPDARELLGVIAFFPHGVHKKNLDWLFPTIHDRRNIFNKFCVLSLTCLSNGFITMLAPIRAYLYPRDPGSSPLLRATKDNYFARLPVGVDPGQPEFGRAEWLRLEDVNVEHLLDVFMPIDTDVGDALDACARFMGHLYWQKSRRTVLGPKIEGLPDGHRCKTKCLFELSRSLGAVGDHTEQKRLLSQVLKLDRERGDDRLVAQTLRWLCDANRMLGLYEEGIQQARKALEIYERLDDTAEQAESWRILAWLLYDNKQLDAAEEAVTRAIGLFPEKGEEFPVCQCHELLGDIYRSKRKRNKAIHHYEIARKIASPLNWHTRLFWVHYSLALLFQDEGAYDNACVHVKQAKLYAARLEYLLGCSAALQTWIWYRQGKLEDARSTRSSGQQKMFGAAGNSFRRLNRWKSRPIIPQMYRKW